MRLLVFVGLVLAFSFAGCMEKKPDYHPAISAADFVQGVTNPYFPLKRGSAWIYESGTGPGKERIVVNVQNGTRNVNGVTATVVRDVVYEGQRLVEDTYDWYAQDKSGNVWYLGEETKEYNDDGTYETEGSWEWGRDGALPGIVMKADPQPDSKPYYQEFYWKEAEDEAAGIQRNERVETPAGTYTDTVTTKEWTRLDSNVEENKVYARGVGLVLERTTKGGSGPPTLLVSFTPG